MSQEQSAINLLRGQFTQSQEWLEGTLQGVTDEIAHYAPAGLPAPIAGQLAHILAGLDFYFLNMLVGKEPLMLTSFAGKAGLSEPPPMSGDGAEWGRTVKVDLATAQAYAKALFAAIDDYLTTLQDSDLQRELDLGPMGKQKLSYAINYMILHNASHTGEIACIKGLQAVRGYPF